MVAKEQKVEIGASKKLINYALKLKEEILVNKALEKKCPGIFNGLNKKFGREIDDLFLSQGLGFDQGYIDCREHQLLRWIEMVEIYTAYSRYEANLDSKKPIDWTDWDKSAIYKSRIWRKYLRAMLDMVSVPDKDAFFQGWCMGVQRFFSTIGPLIDLPKEFNLGIIPRE